MQTTRNTAVLTLLLLALLVPLSRAEEDTAVVEGRLADAVKYLASDELQGRNPGTRGIELAADYIAAQFAEAGLKTDLYDGTPFQKFSFGTTAKLGPGEKNRVVLVGPAKKEGDKPQRIELKLGEQFTPMAIGSSGTFDLPLVFAGYGITAKDAGYDDFQGIDVTGKAVLLLRREPQQDDPESKFNGTRPSRHATFRQKVANALDHGAAAVIVVNDHFELDRRRSAERQAWQQALDKMTEANVKFKRIEEPSPEQFARHVAEVNRLADQIKKHGEPLGRGCDELAALSAAGPHSLKELPVLFAVRAPLDPVVSDALGTDLAALETKIDEGPAPASRELVTWRAVGETNIVREGTDVKNVVAVLEGQGPKAHQTVIVGAHYDHIGWKRSGAEPPKPEDIFNGADDNASGTAVLIEVARRLAAREQKLPRRVVFIAFTAEERGLIGSRHYVQKPLFPLETTVAMVNLDVVGRLRDEKLYVMGTGTATQFEMWMAKINMDHGLKIGNKPSGYGMSDQASFYAARIPVLHFITGGHGDLHRTTDDFEKINVPGMRRVAEIVTDVVAHIAETDDRPEYQKTSRGPAVRGGVKRPFFGAMAAFRAESDGFAIQRVLEGSPAEQAGVKDGDVVIRFGDHKIGSLADFLVALKDHKAGNNVDFVVRRGEEEMTLTVTLGPPK